MSREVEIETVLNGMRSISMPALTLYEFNKLNLPRPLVAKLLGVHSAPQVFHNQVVPWQKGEPFNLRTVIGKAADVDRYIKAYCQKDDTTVGCMLGYPKCCAEAFTRRWKDQKQRDFTWDMMGVKNSMNTAVIHPFSRLNPMFSKLGLRVLHHLPCSIRCEPSNRIAEQYFELWSEQERKWLDEILRWPVEWSALHGAAEIRTPVCKIITDTDSTATEYVVQFAGKVPLPEGSAEGNRFPYNSDIDTHSNNGFSSKEAMIKAHAVILAASREAKDIRSISDPGCGNGVLLNALSLMHLLSDLTGIDLNHHAVAQGRKMFPVIKFIESNLFETTFKKDADLVVFMPGRLMERPDKAEKFVQELNFRYLLLYGYSAYSHKVMELKKRYWPDLTVINTAVDDCGVALLLERK
jgi:hypothetical protein